jgi:hypothetical protein
VGLTGVVVTGAVVTGGEVTGVVVTGGDFLAGVAARGGMLETAAPGPLPWDRLVAGVWTFVADVGLEQAAAPLWRPDVGHLAAEREGRWEERRCDGGFALAGSGARRARVATSEPRQAGARERRRGGVGRGRLRSIWPWGAAELSCLARRSTLP